jgi:hypothetical protein
MYHWIDKATNTKREKAMHIKKIRKLQKTSSSQEVMTELTHLVLMQIFEVLRTKHAGLNGFKSSKDWIKEFSSASIPANSDYRVTRIFSDRPFEKGNVKLVEITSRDDMGNHSFPTIGAPR